MDLEKECVAREVGQDYVLTIRVKRAFSSNYPSTHSSALSHISIFHNQKTAR
jgi:hypothetical protein